MVSGKCFVWIWAALEGPWAPRPDRTCYSRLIYSLVWRWGGGLNDSWQDITPVRGNTWCQNLDQDMEVGVPHQLPIQGFPGPYHGTGP